MFGAILAFMTFYWRMKMSETARYTALVTKNAQQAANDMSKVLQVEIVEEQEKHEDLSKKKSNDFGLFSVYEMTRFTPSRNHHDVVPTRCCLLQPKPLPKGYLHAGLLASQCKDNEHARGGLYGCQGSDVDHPLWDRPRILYWTKPGNHIGFIIMYGLTFCFANFGPNATTFVVPAEIFPARLRSTCQGISSAAGKAGAIVGAGFLYLAQNKDPEKTDAGYPPDLGVRVTLMILGGVCTVGFFATFLVPESKGKSLEKMSGENEDEEEEKNINV
ncbi:LOW QUALITY PROTEIN: hypothetical protein V2J09_014251 [Rumex salicifolius]